MREFIESVPTGVWVLLGSLISVAVGNAFTKWLGKQAEARNDRQDSRAEMQQIWDRMDGLERQVTIWRDRYYAEQAVSASMRVLLIRHGIDPNTAIPIPPQTSEETP